MSLVGVAMLGVTGGAGSDSLYVLGPGWSLIQSKRQVCAGGLYFAVTSAAAF